jgi:hypothetical protein
MTAGEVWVAVLLLAAAAIVVLLQLVVLGAVRRHEKLTRAGLHRMAAIMAGVQDLGGGRDIPPPTADEAAELELDDVGDAAASDPAP